MRYVMARFKTEQRNLAYRIYVTDSLQILTRAERRFADSLMEDLETDANKKEPTESADEIIDRIVGGFNKLVSEDRKEDDE
jgi:hypothetical protein